MLQEEWKIGNSRAQSVLAVISKHGVFQPQKGFSLAGAQRKQDMATDEGGKVSRNKVMKSLVKYGLLITAVQGCHED